jgi:hypothetical protein
MNIKSIMLLGVSAALVLPLVFFIGRGQFTVAGAVVALVFLLLIFRRPDLWWLVAVITLASGLKTGVYDRLTLHQAAMIGFCGLGIMQVVMTQGGSGQLEATMQRRMAWALLFILIGTASIRGWGLRILGSATWGGWEYIVLISAVSFFLLSHRTVLAEKKIWFAVVGLMFLGLLPALVTVLALYMPDLSAAGRFLPVRGEMEASDLFGSSARLQALHIPAVWAGVLAIFYYDRRFKIQVSVLFFALLAFVMMGLSGHRTVPVMLGLLVITYLIVRRDKVPAGPYIFLVLALLVTLTVAYTAVSYLPVTFQRALSVLPGIAVEHEAALTAHGTTAWRIEMWRMMLPMIPQYWFIGRGLAFELIEAYQVYIMASDIQRQLFFIATHAYHNGPLFLLIDLGIGGLVVGSSFMISGIVYFGKRLRKIPPNTRYEHLYVVLFCYYTASVAFFFAVNGTPSSLARILVIASILVVILRSVEHDRLHTSIPEPEADLGHDWPAAARLSHRSDRPHRPRRDGRFEPRGVAAPYIRL